MLKMIRPGLALLTVAVLGVNATAQNPPTAGQTPARAPAPAAAKAQAGAADPALATVNGEEIRQSEIANLLDQFMIPPGSEERAYQNAVELLVNTKLLAQFLEQQRITVNEQEIDQGVARVEQQITQQGMDLASALSESGTTLPQFRDRIARTLQWEKFVTSRATDAELKKYAEANRDYFNNTLVRASHILVSVEPDATEEAKQQARQKIEAIKQQIDSGQISFADAANKFSEDPGNQAKPSGGDLDFFPRKGHFIEPFAVAAFGMQSGQISDPVETEYGFHLIQVTDRREGQPYDFEQMKPQIQGIYAADLQEQVVEATKATADVKIQPMPPGLVKAAELPAAPVQPQPAGSVPATAPQP